MEAASPQQVCASLTGLSHTALFSSLLPPPSSLFGSTPTPLHNVQFATIQKFHAATGGAQPLFQCLDNNGEPQLDSYLGMPENTNDGDLWNPPDAESCAFASLSFVF